MDICLGIDGNISSVFGVCNLSCVAVRKKLTTSRRLGLVA